MNIREINGLHPQGKPSLRSPPSAVVVLRRGYKNQREYDLTIVNIVKYFRLCMDNNPNTIDTLFVPQECITQINHIGQMIRENRKLFLHKGSYYKFSGYAISSLHKMNNKKVAKKEVKQILDKLENTDFTLEEVELELKGRGINF
jgi:hypothetical protein